VITKKKKWRTTGLVSSPSSRATTGAVLIFRARARSKRAHSSSSSGGGGGDGRVMGSSLYAFVDW